MKKYFNDIVNYEKEVIKKLAELVENKKVVIFASGNKWKLLSREYTNHTYDYTYCLIKWGFARKARNTDVCAQMNKYCPLQDFSSTLANFLNVAVEMGFYTRTTKENFDGGQDFQVIWM